MKLSEAPTKIVGLQVGEISLDLIRSGLPMLKVRFALLTEDGPKAFMDVGELGNWSQKSLDAMRAFTEALEEDGLNLIFRTSPGTQASEISGAEAGDGPAQF